MKWVGHVAPMREMRNAYKLLIWKLEGMWRHGKHRRRWDDLRER